MQVNILKKISIAISSINDSLKKKSKTILSRNEPLHYKIQSINLLGFFSKPCSKPTYLILIFNNNMENKTFS